MKESDESGWSISNVSKGTRYTKRMYMLSEVSYALNSRESWIFVCIMAGHERIMPRYDIQIMINILLYHAVCMELDTFTLLSPLLCIVSDDSRHQFKGSTTKGGIL